MLNRHMMCASVALTLAACSNQATPIAITGSSTVYPFTKAVADRFVTTAKDTAAPKIEEVGTIAGIKTFCAGAGAPDVLDASRRINRKEFAICQANHVGDVMEIPIGLDGIALAESDAGPKLQVTDKDLYLALAANPLGKTNTAKLWRDVNPTLPAVPIKVLGPPASSGTRDSFVTLMLEPGCIAAIPDAAAMRSGGDPAKFEAMCRQIRADGPYVAAGEDDTATVKALEKNSGAVGLFGYSYLEQNASRLHGVPLNGVKPDAGTIGSGHYSGARQLFLYVKKAHLERKPAIKDFLNLYAEMWKPGGLLAKAGLIPLSDKAGARSLDTIKNGYPLELDDLP